MASITSKMRASGKVYYIVYSHIEEDGIRKEYWIRSDSYDDATKLLPEVEDYERRNLLYPIPLENRIYHIGVTAKELVQEHGLRPVDPYSLRHSGATAKLRASRDIKAVQGDMGHSSTDMLLNVYADIVDEERQKLAAYMESNLYADSTSNEPVDPETDAKND